MTQPSDMDGESEGNREGNPFTQDFKDGASPEGVSQIFKDGGGFLSTNRTRLIVLSGVLLIVAAGAAYLHMRGDGVEEDSVGEEEKPNVEHPGAAQKEEEAAAKAAAGEEDDLIPDDNVVDKKSGKQAREAKGKIKKEHSAEKLGMEGEQPIRHHPRPLHFGGGGAATAKPAILSPEPNSHRLYDESSEYAEFLWSGGAAWIMFSRNANMKPVEHKEWAGGGKYHFHKPYPGTWYWQLSNKFGMSEIRSFTIQAAVKRQIALVAPAEGQALAGKGGVVSWTGDTRIAYYRVEISNAGWEKPNFRFATSGTQIMIQDVPAGQYDLRLGAFSEVSGQWEYLNPIKVTVQ